MKTILKNMTSFAAAIAVLTVANPTCAQAVEPASDAGAGGVPLTSVIAAVAQNSGKKFIIDPRLRGDVTIYGQSVGSVDYEGLLTILRIHGFAGVETGNYVAIVPDANVRHFAVPVATDLDNRPEAEYVNRVIRVRTIPAVQLVPLLRPMIPQQGHLVALPCKNMLVLVDTAANAKRLEEVIRALDTGTPYTPPQCTAPEPRVEKKAE